MMIARETGKSFENVKRSLKTFDNLDADMEEKLFM